ncbi:MAG TPA: hypothetical protein VK155_18915 [Bacteroidales bacterium]|nr:hypothetical protein [Bacteroidales bacterium]
MSRHHRSSRAASSGSWDSSKGAGSRGPLRGRTLRWWMRTPWSGGLSLSSCSSNSSSSSSSGSARGGCSSQRGM